MLYLLYVTYIVRCFVAEKFFELQVRYDAAEAIGIIVVLLCYDVMLRWIR